jgi:NAD-dependent SIR2 family protein deacetylase
MEHQDTDLVCTMCFEVMTQDHWAIAQEYAQEAEESVRCRHCGTLYPNFISYTEYARDNAILMEIHNVELSTWARILKPARAELSEYAEVFAEFWEQDIEEE